MGIQTMGSQSNGQQSHLQVTRQNWWYSLSLSEVENQLGKPLGSMNLDELLKNVWSSESNENSSCHLQRQASLTLARALSGKTLDEVWKEIQQGQKKSYGEEDMIIQERAQMTLEDFLVQAGLFAQPSLTPPPPMDFDTVDAMGLSPSPSIGTLSDTTTTSARKRDTPDAMEKTLERRLRRKIKNRESAARSRARKQAYHNELVTKVSRLEEDNIKLKKEKEFENMSSESPEPKFQLRRTSSASF